MINKILILFFALLLTSCGGSKITTTKGKKYSKTYPASKKPVTKPTLEAKSPTKENPSGSEILVATSKVKATTEDVKKFNLALTHGKRFFFKDGVPFNIFGMPSGHVQSAFFSTTFIYLSLRHENWFYFYILFSLLIVIQRIVFNYHTILQVIVGALVGAGFAYFVPNPALLHGYALTTGEPK